MTAKYECHGSVAVITLQNPPVNGLGYSTRRDIANGIEQAQADGAITAIVITGAGKAFSGGQISKNSARPWRWQNPTSEV